MTAFRFFLAAFFAALLVYTGITIANHGWNLIAVFFGDLMAMTWPGQFNADFMGFLMLSALWVAWRSRFSLQGLVLAFVALFGGMLFLSAYLLITSLRTGGDMEKMLMGARYRGADR